MLLEFRVGNFLSFKDVQTLRLRRKDKNGTESGSDQIFIYGPNASGKSNLIKAMRFAADIVRNASTFDAENFTFKQYTPYDDLKDVPIPDYSHLDMDNIPYADEPSYFEFILRQDGNDYSLGFEMDFNKKKIISEWLVRLNDNHSIIDNKYDDSISKSSQAREQSIFFGTVGDDPADDIIRWFFTSFIVVPSKGFEGCIPVSDGFEEALERYLAHFDTGIDRVSKIPVYSKPSRYYTVTEETQFVNEYYSSSDNYILFLNDDDGKIRMYSVSDLDSDKEENEGWFTGISEICFRHGRGTSFIANESEGTIKIIQLLILYISQSRGINDTIVIDEMECSIHASLMNELVRMFASDRVKGTQLIATTHETSIMDLDCLDENSFWFVSSREKFAERSSELYSLRSFTGKKEDFKTMYLDGRFEAIPSFMDLNTSDDQEEQ